MYACQQYTSLAMGMAWYMRGVGALYKRPNMSTDKGIESPVGSAYLYALFVRTITCFADLIEPACMPPDGAYLYKKDRRHIYMCVYYRLNL
jgi:hypothetical protein